MSGSSSWCVDTNAMITVPPRAEYSLYGDYHWSRDCTEFQMFEVMGIYPSCGKFLSGDDKDANWT